MSIKRWSGAFALLSGVLVFGACPKTTPPVEPPQPAPEPTGPNHADEFVVVEQGWNAEEQWNWYWLSQGSQLLPYGWYMVLEDIDSAATSAVQVKAAGKPFHRDEMYENWRFLPQPRSDANPDGLAVGWTIDDGYRKDIEDVQDGTDRPKTPRRFMGLTCAACHTSQINVKQGDKTIGVRIEGAGTQGDLEGWLRHLDDVLAATHDDAKRWERFEQNVKSRYPADWSEDLRTRFEYWQGVRKGFTTRTASTENGGTEGAYGGFSRVDAFDGIMNQIVEYALRVPANHGAMDAPVSFPYTWDTPYYSWVEIAGQAANTGIGPLGRNVGEALGTFSYFEMVQPKTTPAGVVKDDDGNIVYDRIPGHFPSTVQLTNLVTIEKALQKLKSPRWKDTPLPAIDMDKALKGANIYTVECARCHISVDRDQIDKQSQDHPGKLLPTFAVLGEDIGTDDHYLRNLNRTPLTGAFEGTAKALFSDKKFESSAPAMDLFAASVEGVTAAKPMMDLGIIGGAILTGRGTQANPPARLLLTPDDTKPVSEWAQSDYLGFGSYKSRALNGTWATAPFLHNGSVPTLWDLLQKPEDRTPKFAIGDFTFDAVKVGYVTESDESNIYTIDTTRTGADGDTFGNDNGGHEYGTELSDEDKWALVEFLKTL